MSRIIVAEDNKMFMVVYSRIIELLGHEFAGFPDGAQAVAAFKREPADMVILDYEMPEMNGLEATREIRRLPEGVAVPIFIVSSHSEEEVIGECLNAGASDYMVKPVQEAQLLAKIKVGLRTSSLHKKDFDLAKSGAEIAGRFKIERLLGYGTHSLVFLAIDTANAGAHVAVKLLNENIDDKEFLAAVVTTAAALERLESPNVLRLLGHGNFSGRVYLAMDYADGGDLAGVLRHRCLNQVETTRMAMHVLAGLADLAREGLSHSDLKPENILLKEGRYLLADFGVVVPRDSVTINLGQELWSTAAYMGPEFYSGEPVDIKTDIYALGVTMYKALTGINPFEASKPSVSMYRQLNFIPPLVSAYEKGLDPELADLIAAMLAKEPARRPGLTALLTTFNDMYVRLEATASQAIPAARPAAEPGAADNKGGTMLQPHGLRKPVKRLGWAANQNMGKNTVHALLEWLPTNSAHKRHWFAAAVTVMVMAASTLVSYSLYALVTKERQASPGAVMCLRCPNCGSQQQRRVVDIDNERCVQCSASMGYAMKCLGCGNEFSVKTPDFPPAGDKAALLAAAIKAKSCPKCHSAKTVPAKPSNFQ